LPRCRDRTGTPAEPAAWYADTSVVGAVYCPGPLSEAAEATLRALPAPPCVSWLTEVEFASLVARKRRMGELDAAEATAVLAAFGGHLAAGVYRSVPLEPPVYEAARRLIAETLAPLRTLDALHLAVVVRHALGLVTADRDMAEAAEALGLAVRRVG